MHPMLISFLKSQEHGYGQLYQKFLSEYNKKLAAHQTIFANWPDS
jgi:hypothetical protein